MIAFICGFPSCYLLGGMMVMLSIIKEGNKQGLPIQRDEYPKVSSWRCALACPFRYTRGI